MRKKKASKSIEGSTGRLGGPVVLVHTTDATIVRALGSPRVTQLGFESFLEGSLISPTPGHFDDGKLVRLNLRYVVSITEFDSVDQFMQRKKGDLKLIQRERRD